MIFITFRFRPIIVKETIHNILVERLTDQNYNGEEITPLTKQISDEIKDKLKGDWGTFLISFEKHKNDHQKLNLKC